MVVDVATALMYGAQGHSCLFPMFGLDHVYLGEELYSLSVGYWYCL